MISPITQILHHNHLDYVTNLVYLVSPLTFYVLLLTLFLVLLLCPGGGTPVCVLSRPRRFFSGQQ